MTTRAPAGRPLTPDAVATFDAGERYDVVRACEAFPPEPLESATEAIRIHAAFGYSTQFDI